MVIQGVRSRFVLTTWWRWCGGISRIGIHVTLCIAPGASAHSVVIVGDEGRLEGVVGFEHWGFVGLHAAVSEKKIKV